MVHNLLGTSDKKQSVRHKGIIELRIYLILGLIREIDQYISANDQMATFRISIL